MSYNDNRDSGGVVISNDVIASIAANAVKDLDGLARLRCGALIMILKFSFL